MALIIKDRVKEGTVTTGTGAFTLGGAASTFEAFNTYMSNGDTAYYAVVHTASGVDEWEVGLGTWNTGNTLTRTTILSSSNSGNAVSFSSGTKDIFMTYPADRAVIEEPDRSVSFPAGISVTGNVAASGTIDGRDVAADGTKLDGIATSANNYSHPTFNGDDIDILISTLSGASVISALDFNVSTDTNGHVTDANGTVSTRNLTLGDLGYTGATNANNYSHPTGNGNNHVPSNGSSGQFLGYSSAGTAAWVASPTPSTTAGAVGTYLWAYYKVVGGYTSFGSTYAGSSIYSTGTGTYPYSGQAYGDNRGGSQQSGTWRSMGDGSGGASRYGTTLFCRIS